ncbi:MAG TPA: PEP-CTERM sorting domain-containing protein [Bryobacteraceae bacterium]|nr:PEP-CTERM sorting domain-containing protein [Bryobacteraceae bacterium]
MLGLAFTGVALRANILVVGDPPMLGTGNCDPFGCPGFLGLSTYQQVYLSSAFPSSISIVGLTFYEGQVHNGGQPAGGSYTLSFSYTTFAPGSLDLTNPNNNISSSSENFFSGALPTLTPEGGGNFLVISGTPFVYNPADGNLLLTVTVTGGTNSGTPLFLNESVCGPQTICPQGSSVVTGNAYFGNANGGNDIGGLVTGFDYSTSPTTPEPGTLISALAGFGLIAYRRRRGKAA